MIQLLLDSGAEIDRVDDSEESASHYSDLLSAYRWANKNNRPRIVQLFWSRMIHVWPTNHPKTAVRFQTFEQPMPIDWA